jgi:hypothetical protein
MLTNQIAQGLWLHHSSIYSLLRKGRYLKNGTILNMKKLWGAKKLI